VNYSTAQLAAGELIPSEQPRGESKQSRDEISSRIP